MRFDLLPETPKDERKLIGFYVGDTLYGVDIMDIREIINPGSIVEVPSAPSYVLGITDHRGTVVPVVDLRARFGIEPHENDRKTKWLLVKVDQKDVGLLVDRVLEVLKLSDSQLRESHPLMNERKEAWIKNVYGLSEGLVFELDLQVIANVDITHASLTGEQ